MSRASDAPGRAGSNRSATPSRRIQATFLFVVLTLAMLSVLPYWTGRRVELLRQETESIINPAVRLARKFEFALAMQTAAARGYALTRDVTMLVESQAAAQAGMVSLERLGQFTMQLSPRVQSQYDSISRLADDWYRITASRDAPDPIGVTRGLPQQQLHFETLITTANRLVAELDALLQAHHAMIISEQRRALTITVVLFMLSVFAAAAVAWMMWRQRMLLAQFEWAHARAEKSAEEEQALRAAAAAVAAPITTSEVVRQIAGGAVDATGARGAIMGRFLDDNRLEVIAAAGSDTPKPGSTIVYAGSGAEQAVRSHTPVIQRDFHEIMSNRTTVVVPMFDAEGAIGVLALIYAPDVEPAAIGPDALARASTFADLATVALRKARLLEESEQRRHELQRISDSRALLLRGFSHDLKNPLWAADGFLQLLEAGVPSPLTAEQTTSVQRARRSLKAGFKLLHDLLDLAKAGTDHIQLHVAPCDLDQLLCEVVEEHRGTADNRNVALVMKESVRIPTLQTDGARVRQIVSNLASNGIKYTEPGGRVEVSAEIRPAAKDGEPPWIAIHVTDTGPGIHPEDQEAIFQEFVRLESAEHVPGAGLGLAISQRVAHALGGRITLRSRIGAGSTFTLWLPLRRPAKTAVEKAPDSERDESRLRQR